jgi:hypothetical protein
MSLDTSNSTAELDCLQFKGVTQTDEAETGQLLELVWNEK